MVVGLVLALVLVLALAGRLRGEHGMAWHGMALLARDLAEQMDALDTQVGFCGLLPL